MPNPNGISFRFTGVLYSFCHCEKTPDKQFNRRLRLGCVFALFIDLKRAVSYQSSSKAAKLVLKLFFYRGF